MNRTEYLLTCLAEECNEVAQRVSKILRFGLNEVQPGYTSSNLTRLNEELADLCGVVRMLYPLGIQLQSGTTEKMIEKEKKVNKYFEYSKQIGVANE